MCRGLKYDIMKVMRKNYLSRQRDALKRIIDPTVFNTDSYDHFDSDSSLTGANLSRNTSPSMIPQRQSPAGPPAYDMPCTHAQTSRWNKITFHTWRDSIASCHALLHRSLSVKQMLL